MTGTTISHYEIGEKLGEGGMGVVYRAVDTRLKRSVALKFLSPRLAITDEERKRFIREAQAASSLEHPNICTIHEIDQTPDGQLYLVMPAYDGVPLDQRIEQGPFPVDQAIDFGLQIASGLQATHENGVIHRDIKSSNVLLTQRGQIKILDFGLARSAALSAITRSGVPAGTPLYMSPEQARGERVDHRTDIWSLGVVLYELLTGRRPFEAAFEQAVLYRLLHEDPEPLTKHLPDMPARLERIIEKALEKKPEHRYQRVDELIDDLRELKREFDAGTAPTRRVRLRILRKRRPLVYAALVALPLVPLAMSLLLGRAPAHGLESIAVLPLENLTGDPDQEYFVAGMHDGLITELGRVSALRVISRQTMMRYRDSEKSVPEIARELNVAGVIEASVLRSGEHVHLGVRLVRAVPEERSIWAETFERELHGVRSMHAEVARAVTEQIGVPLRPGEAERLARERTVNPDVYEAYLRGMYHIGKGTADGIAAGMGYLHEAIEQDPGDALAYAGLALGYITVAHGPEPPAEALSLARAAAERAVRLDETLAEAHAALGFIKGYYDWEWAVAQRTIDRAIEMDPNLAIAHYHDAWYHVLFGRMEEAIAAHRRAQELDPLVPMHTAWLGEIYLMLGRFDEALAEAERAIGFAPQDPLGYVILARVRSDQGRHDEAIAAYGRAGELSREWRWAAAPGYVRAGRPDEARRLLDELELEPVTPWNAWGRAVIHASLGDVDEAFRWLGYERPHAWLPWIRVLDWFDPLHQDPRFDDLLRRMNLPPR